MCGFVSPRVYSLASHSTQTILHFIKVSSVGEGRRGDISGRREEEGKLDSGRPLWAAQVI